MPRRLRLAFEDVAALRTELERNIGNGGAFVPGAEPCELREVVEVELDFRFCDELLTLEAEVVHVVPGPSGCDLAVQFLCPASELREKVGALVEAAGRRHGGDDAWEIDLDAPARTPVGAAPPAADAAPPAESGAPRRERRASPRGPARVPATVAAAHVELDGRTRDLSETGVLVSADASELPLGKAVALSLRHPETGERVQVAGRVTRHVEGEGAVAAVAIAFDGPRDDPALAAFVQAARETEATRTHEGIRGRVEELGMPNLLQMLAQSSSQGTLTVTRRGEEGVVAFEAGRLRYARLGAARGRKAMARLLAWPDGRFVFHAAVDRLEEEDERLPLQALLLDAARALDEEAAQPTGPVLRPDATFRLDREVLAGCEGLSKTEEAVVDLAAAGFTVRRMLDVIPDDDAAIREALAALRERGVLVADGAARG